MPTRIVEWQLPYTWGTGIEIDTNKVISILLREEDNLIQVNGDNELYTDLQLVANIKPSDDFPVWVTTGKILQSDWWTQSGLLLNWKTTSGDYARWIYANDWKIYFDNWTGTWKQVYYSSEVDNLIQTLRNYVDTFQPKLTAGTGIVIDQNNVISTTWGQGTWDVIWPNSSTDWNLAVFDGITGKVLKDGWPIPAPTTVVDALDSTSTTSALSANQWRILDWKIADMMGLGKFLSLWNSTTGQPISFPLATPYTYTTWDYFIIEVVSSATPPVNYRPNGSSYTGTASSVAETDEIEIWDVYVYDWQTWLLQSNHGKTVAFANIAGQPTDNTALANALNDKQGVLTAWTNIDITNNVISAEGLTILSYGNSTWNDFITAYNRWWLVYCRASSNSNPASWTQGRMAFMAYLNNPTTPTEVEFQYYRSVTTKSASQQGDQVYVYKLTSSNWGTWTVETREAVVKIVAGTNMSQSYSNWTLTVNNTAPFNATNWGVKVFDFPAVNDDITDLVTWLNSWWDAILKESNSYCRVTSYDGVNNEIHALQESTNARDDWAILYNSSNIVTSVSSVENKYWDKIEYVTQAEYNALPSSKLTDNKHYFIYSQSWPTPIEYTITWSTTVGSYTPPNFSDLQGFFISPDGLNAYVTFWNNFNGRMAQYSLSTPWDISTASQTQYISLIKPNWFCFSNDGVYMFYSTEDWNEIRRYTLSTPRDISTASLDSGQSLAVPSSFAPNVCVSDDGEYIYFWIDDTASIYQYELTTPFDLTTATNQKTTSTTTGGMNVQIKNNGKYLYMAHSISSTPVKQYELSTPYDISSTKTEVGSKTFSSYDEWRCLFVSNDGQYWTMGNSSGWVTQFEAQPIS